MATGRSTVTDEVSALSTLPPHYAYSETRRKIWGPQAASTSAGSESLNRISADRDTGGGAEDHGQELVAPAGIDRAVARVDWGRRAAGCTARSRDTFKAGVFVAELQQSTIFIAWSHYCPQNSHPRWYDSQVSRGWGCLVADPGDCRENANRCLAMASQATDAKLRATFFQLAKSWSRLAEQLEQKPDFTDSTPVKSINGKQRDSSSSWD